MLPYEVDINYTNNTSDEHYVMTPYSFNPKLGHKLYANEHIDIGQGLLDCLAEQDQPSQVYTHNQRIAPKLRRRLLAEAGRVQSIPPAFPRGC